MPPPFIFTACTAVILTPPDTRYYHTNKRCCLSLRRRLQFYEKWLMLIMPEYYGETPANIEMPFTSSMLGPLIDAMPLYDTSREEAHRAAV